MSKFDIKINKYYYELQTKLKDTQGKKHDLSLVVYVCNN